MSSEVELMTSGQMGKSREGRGKAERRAGRENSTAKRWRWQRCEVITAILGEAKEGEGIHGKGTYGRWEEEGKRKRRG